MKRTRIPGGGDTWRMQLMLLGKSESALAHGFVQTDSGCNGYIQARNFAAHGDTHQEIAVCLCESAHAVSFGSHDYGYATVEVNVVERAVAVV